MRRGGWIAVFVLLALPFGLLAADPPGKRLQDIETAIETERSKARSLEREASAIDVELEDLNRKMVEIAAGIQDYEESIISLENQIATIAVQQREAARRMERDHDRFALVLAALARMARHPPESLVAQPLSPIDTVRSALLLRASLPQIANRARRLKGEIADIVAIRHDMDLHRTELASLRLTLDSERRRLDEMLAQKRDLKERTTQAMEKSLAKAGELAGEAESLKDLLARLERERLAREEEARRAKEALKERPSPALGPDEEPEFAPDIPRAALDGRSIAKAKGSLVFPVVGSLDGHYGDRPSAGAAIRRGITIRARAEAQVVAPFGGLVVFADRFRAYGQLLIIEHPGGYHTLLAGLGRIDGKVGQAVTAGEPIGSMGRPEDGKSTLYVELRRRGQPIDPLPWLAMRKGKDSG